jgi:hypothetical protein
MDLGFVCGAWQISMPPPLQSGSWFSKYGPFLWKVSLLCNPIFQMIAQSSLHTSLLAHKIPDSAEELLCNSNADLLHFTKNYPQQWNYEHNTSICHLSSSAFRKSGDFCEKTLIRCNWNSSPNFMISVIFVYILHHSGAFFLNKTHLPSSRNIVLAQIFRMPLKTSQILQNSTCKSDPLLHCWHHLHCVGKSGNFSGQVCLLVCPVTRTF